MGIDQHRHHVALASGVLIMITMLFWVAVTPLLLYLLGLLVVVVIAKLFR